VCNQFSRRKERLLRDKRGKKWSFLLYIHARFLFFSGSFLNSFKGKTFFFLFSMGRAIMSLDGKLICYTAPSNMYWIIIYTTCKVLNHYTLLCTRHISPFIHCLSDERKKLILYYSSWKDNTMIISSQFGRITRIHTAKFWPFWVLLGDGIVVKRRFVFPGYFHVSVWSSFCFEWIKIGFISSSHGTLFCKYIY